MESSDIWISESFHLFGQIQPFVAIGAQFSSAQFSGAYLTDLIPQ